MNGSGQQRNIQGSDDDGEGSLKDQEINEEYDFGAKDREDSFSSENDEAGGDDVFFGGEFGQKKRHRNTERNERDDEERKGNDYKKIGI